MRLGCKKSAEAKTNKQKTEARIKLNRPHRTKQQKGLGKIHNRHIQENEKIFKKNCAEKHTMELERRREK